MCGCIVKYIMVVAKDTVADNLNIPPMTLAPHTPTLVIMVRLQTRDAVKVLYTNTIFVRIPKDGVALVIDWDMHAFVV